MKSEVRKMSSESLKYKAKEKLLDSKLMNLFAFFKRGEFPLLLFYLLAAEPIREHLRYPGELFNTAGISLTFLLIILGLDSLMEDHAYLRILKV